MTDVGSSSFELVAGSRLEVTDNFTLKTRTFELIRLLSGKVVSKADIEANPVSTKPLVIVWRVVEVLNNGEEGEEFVIKFYNPERTVVRSIGSTEGTSLGNLDINFFFDQEIYINTQIRGTQDVVKIIGDGTVRGMYETRADGIAVDSEPTRKFVIQSTSKGSWDLLVVTRLLNVLFPDVRPKCIQLAQLKVVVDMCSALDKLHRKQVYHQDIKPENVVVGSKSKLENIIREWNARFGTSWTMDQVTNPERFDDNIARFVVPDDAKQGWKVGRVTNFLMMAAVLVYLTSKQSGLDLEVFDNQATEWVRERLDQVETLVIDIDRSRSINDIEDLFDIGSDGTPQYTDPWIMYSFGKIDEYPFGTSTPQQRIRAAMMGYDYWSTGMTIFEFINGFNFLQPETDEAIAMAARKGLDTEEDVDEVMKELKRKINLALGDLDIDVSEASLGKYKRKVKKTQQRVTKEKEVSFYTVIMFAETIPRTVEGVPKYFDLIGLLSRVTKGSVGFITNGSEEYWRLAEHLMSIDISSRFNEVVDGEDRLRTLDVVVENLSAKLKGSTPMDRTP